MEKLFILFLLITSLSFSQEKTIEIDYFVDYVIPSKRQTTTDTISIGFNKDGKYLWTNYNKLALDLAKSLIKNSSEDYSKAKSNIIYDTEEGSLLLTFEFNKNFIFFNLNLDSFLPFSESDESFNLITEDIGETMKVLDREVNIYNIFPDDKPEEILTIATDIDYKVNNSAIFKKFFEIAFRKSGMEDNNLPQFPDGLILKIIETENTLLEAIKISDKKKTIKINYSLKITE